LLTGGLSTLQNKKIDIKTYFNVHKISLNHSFKWQHIEFHLIQVLHTMSGYKITPCFGLYFTIKGIKILFTADIQFYPNLMMSFYEDADIIFHDCQTKHTDYSAHAQYDELKTLPLHIKNKIWLYHYNPDHTQNSEQDGFRGFVKKGQVFKF
jgi:ribonuclease BN (tRNA processing enzyme)